MIQQSLAVKLVISTIGCTLIILLFLDESVIKLIPPDYDSILKTDSTPFSDSASNGLSSRANETLSDIMFDFCELPDLDPWDPIIEKYLNPNRVPWGDCKPNVTIYSSLKEGVLFIDVNQTGGPCFYRCLNPHSDFSMIFMPWHSYKAGARPLCDVVEVQCTTNLDKGVPQNSSAPSLYHFLHTQVYRKEEDVSKKTYPKGLDLTDSKKDEPEEAEEKPDVHIILFDSVSESQFLRSMPKTRHVLREYYDAVTFRHLNKIGLNSRPNGFALLLGKTIGAIPASPVSHGHASDYDRNTYCSQSISKDQFIGFRFQDDGYKTMMSEDWSLGVFNWPNCHGFNVTPTDHYMRPWQLRVEGGRFKSNYLRSAVHRSSCRETYYYQMEYLKQFVDRYPDKPKFSLSWMSYLAHDDGNALYHTDNYFYRFFKDYRQKFSNSYLFVMGDHGNRFGYLRRTSVGEIEDNNPFLFFAVPEKMRKNVTLIEQIRSNAKQLVTHYDLYATLIGVTNPAAPRIPNPLIKGNSILKPLPGPRTCDRLRIPFDYCTCKKEKNRLPAGDPLGPKAADLIIAKINKALQSENDTKDACAELTLNTSQPILTDKFVTKSTTSMYRVELTTVPGNGNFWAFVLEKPDKTLEIMSEKCPRLDAYAAQVKCASRAKYASYCFCKNLLKKAATTKTPVLKPKKPTRVQEKAKTTTAAVVDDSESTEAADTASPAPL